jgi:hypothetical protein
LFVLILREFEPHAAAPDRNAVLERLARFEIVVGADALGNLEDLPWIEVHLVKPYESTA